MPLLTSLLLLSAAQGGKIQAPKGPLPKTNPSKINLKVAPPVLFVLPLYVTGPARDDSPQGRTEQLMQGFDNGLQLASQQEPSKRGEAKILDLTTTRRAIFVNDQGLREKGQPVPPKANKGTPLDPVWSMSQVAKIATAKGADYIILAYVNDFRPTQNNSNYSVKATGTFTMWSAKTGNVVFADAPFGGNYSRPKVQGAFSPGEIGATLSGKELRPTFYEFWGKKNWKGQS